LDVEPEVAFREGQQHKGNMNIKSYSSIGSFIFAAFAAVTLSGTPLMAQVVLPVGLSPGTQYQLIFLTYDSFPTPTDSNIADYNSFVTTEANQNSTLAALDVQWNAIVSTATTAANANAPSSGLVYNTAGTEVASPTQQLYSGALLAPENGYDQNGLTDGEDQQPLFTGSTATGGISPYPYGGNPYHTELGYTGLSTGGWLDEGLHNTNQTETYPLYALSTEITVIPEPTTFGLVAIGLLSVLTIRRRKV
jgi:hypothetical protein